MIRILTKEEYAFMTKFADLIKSYGVLFTPDGVGGVDLEVFSKESTENPQAMANPEELKESELYKNEYDEGHTFIHFPTRFDHSDVEVIVECTDKYVEMILQEEKEKEQNR